MLLRRHAPTHADTDTFAASYDSDPGNVVIREFIVLGPRRVRF